MIRIKAINHSIHQQHDLHLLEHDSFYKCNVCSHSGFGPRFSCPNWSCNFNLHEECCAKLTPMSPISSHRFLVGCKFIISQSRRSQNPTYCNACRRIIRGSYYHCNNSDRNLNLHLSCARLPRTITSNNGTQMTLKNKHEVRCSYSECPNVNSGWSYYSPDNQYNYHVPCWKKQMLNNANHLARRIELLALGDH